MSGTQPETGTLGRRPRLIRREQLQWPIVALLAVIALVLGYIGFAQNAAARGLVLSPLDLLYLTLQLIPMNSGAVDGPVPWELQVARYLVPALTAYTAGLALAAVFRDQIALLRLRLIGGHVVICGLGRTGFLLATALRKRGQDVVVIEADEDNDLIEPCRQHGVTVIIGDASSPDWLYRAATDKARNLIAVTGDDGVNAEVAVRAQELTAQRHGAPLTCIVHIVDPQLCELLREHEFGLNGATMRLELFNIFDRGARLVLEEYSPFKMAGRAPHILLLGIGKMGESLVFHAAQEWRDRRGASKERLRITALDRWADARATIMPVRYPKLASVCDVQFVQMDVRAPEFVSGAFLSTLPACDFDIVYVCLDQESLAVSSALSLQQRLRGRDIPIVVRMANEGGLGALLQTRPNGHGPQLHVFGLLDRTSTPDLLIGGTHEILARALHEEYLRSPAPTSGNGHSRLPWNELPEDLKESNRRQVDRIAERLDACGCGFAPSTDWDATPVEFTPEEVERMAQMEHAAWCRDLRAQGWTFAAGPANAQARTHPDLVAWETLPESEKEKNRRYVRELPRFLAHVGFEVYRIK